MKKFLAVLVVLSALVFLCACSSQSAEENKSNISQGSYVTGVEVNETKAGLHESFFDIQVKKANDPIGVMLRGQVSKGSLYAVILDEAGNPAWKSDPVSGVFRFNTTLTNLPAGQYKLTTGWDEPVAATFDLYTVPGGIRLPVIQPIAIAGGAGMILVALGFFIYAALKRLGWKFIGLGALSWVVTVAVKFAIAIPLNSIIYGFLVNPKQPGLGDYVFDVYVGLLTGITEVLMVWLLVRYTRIRDAGWKKALGFGIGFGAVEALLLGIQSFGAVLAAIMTPNLLPIGTLDTLASFNNLAWGVAPISERFFTVLVHIFCNVLIFYGAATLKPGYFWLSFAFKSLIDAVAGYAQLTGVDTLAKIWTIEAIVIVFGIVGWAGTRWISKRYPPLPQANP
jgi:uncharacterized membrane protein YhfC